MKSINQLIALLCMAVITACNTKPLAFNAVVSQDGTGDHVTVQEAIDQMPENLDVPWRILVKNGQYREQVIIPANKPFVHLIGEDKNATIIHHKLNVGGKPEADVLPEKTAYWKYSVHNPNSEVYQYEGAVVNVNATNFYAENISFVNDWGVDEQAGPQALAMKIRADKAAFTNVSFVLSKTHG